MKDFWIKGTIVDNDDKLAYDWYGMESTCPNDVQKFLQEANGEEVRIIVSSGGGDVFAGENIRFMLKDYKGQCTIHCTSIAASAAAIICTARKCTAEPVAMFMWHNVACVASGDYNAMNKTSELLQKANKSIAQALMQKTGKTEEEVLAIMNAETWYTAQEAKEHGIVDSIEGENSFKLVASTSELLPQSLINKAMNERHELKALEVQINLLKLKGVNNA